MIPVQVSSPDGLGEVAARILEQCAERRVYALYGKMGAGKTTFVTALCKQLGVSDRVASPTYALVNEYLSRNGEPVYHFDFYRIEGEDEAYDMGFEEYLDSGMNCFIEWPERVESLLPSDVVRVHIEVHGEERLISWKLE